MRTAVLSALIMSTLLAPAARAETSAEREACTPDVWRLCASEIPNVGAIKTCLHRERARLSTTCRTVMDATDGPVRTVANRR